MVAWTAGVVLGRTRVRSRQANVSPSELKTLQGRMLHAQNMGMRLQELASNQQRLQEEQAHLQLLQDLKDEVHWLLSEVESTLTKHHEHDPDRLEDMLDATYFERTFPGVPLLGYYAGGEIGPEARVAREDAFMCSNAAVQGFTAVFGVFIVPERNLADFDMNLTAEDTEEAWEKHSRSVVVEAAKKKAPA